MNNESKEPTAEERRRRFLQLLLERGLLTEIKQPLPPEARRPEHPPVPVEGEPVSELIMRERR